jgi:NAD+ kinase
VNIKTVALFIKPDSQNLKIKFLQAKDIFTTHNIKVLLCDKEYSYMGELSKEKDMCQKADTIVSLGGDGTLISAARKSIGFDIPILAVNLGTLGFLADLKLEELDRFLSEIANDRYNIEPRMLLEIYTNKDNPKTMYALNDIVFTRTDITKMIDVEISLNNTSYNHYYGDGVIICTPTGSTAYNLASHGPIVFPGTDAITVTPISSHSLTQRAIVLPKKSILNIKTDKNTMVIIDGQDTFEIDQNARPIIKRSNYTIKLIQQKDRDYFKILSNKLMWGNL